MLSPDEERDLGEYLRALFSNSGESFLESISELEVPSPYKVRAKILYSPISPIQVVNRLVEAKVLDRLSDSNSYSWVETVGRKVRRQVRSVFHMASFPQSISEKVSALISVCTREQWHSCTRLIARQYPEIVPILLSQAELIQSAKSLRSVAKHEVRVRSLSAKEATPDETGRRKSVREWTDEHLDDVILSVQERSQVVTSLDVEFFPRLGNATHIVPRAGCKIRKGGELEVTGSFRLAFDTVASHVARVGEHKLAFLSNRGLRENSYKPRPISIDFAKPVFDETENVRSLVSQLASYPHSIHSVQHGNPYGHVRIADMFDGSSFDVWAIPPQRLALMPGLKATEAAMERLVHYVFDSFREGDLSDYGGAGKPERSSA